MKYLTSHPWLKFEFSSKFISPKFWLILGEIQSKCRHIAGVPLRPSTAKELHFVYLAKGVHATTAIEGNTLTEEEVLRQMKGDLKVPPSKEYLAQETKNIEDAYNAIINQALKGELSPLNAATIKGYNALVLRDLPREDHVVPGEYAEVQVGVGRYRGAPPGEIPFLMERLCDWLSGSQFYDATGEHPIVHGLLKAILAHLYLAWIHPFGDGNGRTARLVELRLLVEAGIPTPATHLLSDHYNQTRSEYYRQLAKASATPDGDYISFIEYALQGFLDGLKEQLQRILNQQIDVSWRNYVHEFMHEHDSAVGKRRRVLVLELSMSEAPIPVSQLRFATPGLSRAYAGKTERTLLRDINWLEENELIKKRSKGYEANKTLILAFLPRKAAE